jgi:hypothetical protein
MGTGFVESLTSYTTRLAAAHSLSPATLLGRVLAPIMDKNYWFQGGARSGTRGSALSNSLSSRTTAINSTGVIAQDWVVVLEKLTSRNDLRFLTMIPWADALTRRNLLRPTRAWCPSCYEKWRRNDQIVYEPLLWTFQDVEVCVRHQRRLRFHCQHCGCNLPWLARRARSGYCSKCRQWLGADLNDRCTDLTFAQGELAWQIWVAKNLEEMIVSGTYLPSPSKQRIAKAISLCIDQVTEGTMNRFAYLIGKRKNTVWGWQHGSAKVPMSDLLRICHCVGISLIDFLHTEFVVPQGTEMLPAKPSVSGAKIRRHPPTAFDHENNNQTLRAILKETPPPSMKEVAERVNINKRSLYKHSSSLCRAISARHSKYREACYHNQQNRQAIDVRQAANTLESNGIYPSRRRVAALIKKRSSCMSEGQPPSWLHPVP